MTKARDLAGFASSSVTTTASDGLVLKGDGSSTDVVIKNGANATVATVADGATGVTFAGTPTFPDGSINIADLDIDGGTDIGAALVDADLMIVDDGAGGTNRKATMTRLATYMGTKIGGGMEFIASSGAISSAATVDFTGFNSSKYDSYEFRFIDFLPATDDVSVRALTSSDTSNPSYDTGSEDYVRSLTGKLINDNYAYGALSATNAIGNAANEGFTGIVRVINPHTSTYTKVSTTDGVRVDNLSNVASISSQGGFVRRENAQVNAIRFFYSSGNVASGEVIMFGIVNS